MQFPFLLSKIKQISSLIRSEPLLAFNVILFKHVGKIIRKLPRFLFYAQDIIYSSAFPTSH